MRKVRNFAIAIITMMMVALVALLVTSVLAFLLKWQADKAMVGIIATYIVAGFAGGFCFKCIEKRHNNMAKASVGRKAVEAFVMSNVFMLILLLLSVFVLQNPLAFSGRLLMIWLLLMSSTFLGRIL